MDAEEAMKKHMAVLDAEEVDSNQVMLQVMLNNSLLINTEKNMLSYTLPTVATEA
jgi:hypothetical protein